MEEHIIDAEMASKLEEDSRYCFLSREELLKHIQKGDTVVEIGSGTGFYTDDIADLAEKVYAVDFQEEMHKFYRNKGVPENVELVHSKASEIEIEEVDTVVSIFSFHEINVEKALQKFLEILGEEGTLIIYDWSSKGSEEQGPPLEKRYSAESATHKVSGFFKVEESFEREDTFYLKASVR